MKHDLKRIVCFDFDDTPAPSSCKYHRQIWRCGLIICKALGAKSPSPLDVLKLHDETNVELVRRTG